MAETKYGKYILYETPPPLYADLWRKVYERDKEQGKARSYPKGGAFQMSDNVFPGAFYMGINWVYEANDESHATKPQIHDNWDEYLIFMGGNPDDPANLNAEVELWLEDEKHIITKSCVVFIPHGLQHCPIIFRRVDRPFIWVTVGPTPQHTARFNRDPKWDKFLEPPALPKNVY